jgi:predicted  nucleic acid-binding Zn-ribbon protein
MSMSKVDAYHLGIAYGTAKRQVNKLRRELTQVQEELRKAKWEAEYWKNKYWEDIESKKEGRL